MPVLDPNTRPAQLGSPAVAALIKVGSRINAKLYQLSGGRIGGSWRVGAGFRKPVPVLLLTTIGRKSGEPRTAPLNYLRKGDSFVVVASQGGLPKNPAWYLNLVATPEVCVQVGRERHDLVARTATGEEREALWNELVELYADYDTYAAWTDREIPVVICEKR
ncbi:nitroreductase family deazaflavin-dependent oxidoreductase [Gordonia sp. CPCC 205515]|uniref:nitroreductase family deazaflavin-dependent oxidoreductase n=1 Tax=Gordonia sp. CPCC 205515 TaxID=3140791 RepID=UPI003AF338AC